MAKGEREAEEEEKDLLRFNLVSMNLAPSDVGRTYHMVFMGIHTQSGMNKPRTATAAEMVSFGSGRQVMLQ